MGKRTNRGMIDPYMPRVHHTAGRRRTTIPANHRKVPGCKDDFQTARTLESIQRESFAKERAAMGAVGPSSTPDPHYPKSIFIKRPRERDE